MDIKKLRKELIEQKKSKFKGNIYHYSQVNFAYNSNKIEGSRLTSDQTEAIFENSHVIMTTSSFDTKNKIYIAQPSIIGKDGIEKVIKLDLTDDENAQYMQCVKAISDGVAKLK